MSFDLVLALLLRYTTPNLLTYEDMMTYHILLDM